MLHTRTTNYDDNSHTGLLSNSSTPTHRYYSSIDDAFHDPQSEGFLKKAIAAYQAIRTRLGLNPLTVSGFVLVLAAVMERVTFKVMIDHMLPYKFVLVEIISALACMLFTAVTMFLIFTTKQITAETRQFPQVQILNMAILDTLQFLLLVYSGAGVSPTMTVILIHSSTLFVVLASKYVFPNRKYGSSHSQGMALMGGAVGLGLLKILWNDYSDPSDHYYSVWSAFVFVTAASLQGLSTLYKEYALAAWSRPINLYYLSACLFFYQFLVTFAFSVVFYLIFGLIGEEVSLSRSLYNGWWCFLGDTPTISSRDDDLTIVIDCSASLWVIMGYVVSTVGVLVCLHNVLEIDNQIVPRLLSVAIVASFLLLWIYDVFFSELETARSLLGGSVGVVDLVAVALVTFGTEVYGRDPEPDVELITHFSSASQKTPAASPAQTPSPASTGGNDFIALSRDNNSNRTVLRN